MIEPDDVKSGIMVHESEQSVPSGHDQRICAMVPTVEIVIGTSRFIHRCRDAEQRSEVAAKARASLGFDTSVALLEGKAIIADDHIKNAEAAIERLAATNGDLRHAVARLEARWQNAEPFVDAAIDLYNEALEDSFAAGVVPTFDRRDVTAALAPAMNGLMALHETFTDAEIDDQLRKAGGDPAAIAERGKAKILELLQKRREARR